VKAQINQVMRNDQVQFPSGIEQTEVIAFQRASFLALTGSSFTQEEADVFKQQPDSHSHRFLAAIRPSQQINPVAANAPRYLRAYLDSRFVMMATTTPQAAPRFSIQTIGSSLNYAGNRPIAESSENAQLGSKFHMLAQQWVNETSFHSSLGEIFTNDAYQRIMAMGRDALPFIFSDLQKKPRHWFYALEKIIGFDVAQGAKSFAEARAAWLEWGYKNNYI
jgi:hypothetical protein